MGQKVKRTSENVVSRNRTATPQPSPSAKPVFLASRNVVAKLVGYVRVSRTSQNLDAQTDALKAAGADVIYADHGVSGAKKDREGLDSAIAELRGGDILIVVALDRLGRDLPELFRIIERLHERGAHLRSQREAIDTTTIVGRMLFGIFGALSEFELALVKERTAERLSAKKRRGERIGRKLKLTPSQIQLARELLETGDRSATTVARHFHVDRSTLYRALSKGTKDA